ncbi:hypothetical protein KI387_038059, partial [Taxus chinensis]
SWARCPSLQTLLFSSLVSALPSEFQIFQMNSDPLFLVGGGHLQGTDGGYVTDGGRVGTDV